MPSSPRELSSKDRGKLNGVHVLRLSVQRCQHIRRIEGFTQRGVKKGVPLWGVNLVLAPNVGVGSVLRNVGEKVRAVSLGNCRNLRKEVRPDVLDLVVYIPFKAESLVYCELRGIVRIILFRFLVTRILLKWHAEPLSKQKALYTASFAA